MARLFVALLGLLFSAGAAFAANYYMYEDWPKNAEVMNVASPNSPNTAISVSLQGVPGWYTYVTGLYCQFAGATAAGEVTGTLASVKGVDGNATTLNVIIMVPAGATIQGQTINVQFTRPMPANGPGQGITWLMPALGAGNLYAACFISGFRVPVSAYSP